MTYHKITIIGHTGSDPEHEVTATGKDVAVFPLYVNVRYGEKERNIRYKVKAWNDLSITVKKHLLKGQLLLVEGTPSLDVWQTAGGEPRAQLVVTAQMLRFLGAKPSTIEEVSGEDF